MEREHDLLLAGVTLLTGTEVIRNGWLAISGDRISALGGPLLHRQRRRFPWTGTS